MKLNMMTKLGGFIKGLGKAPYDNPFSAAATLPDLPTPTVKKGQLTTPSYRTQAERSEDLLRRVTRVTANTDATTFRTNSDPAELIRNFLAANPDMAATVNAYLRVGIPRDFTITAHDMDGRINPQVTAVANEILTRITYLSDPTLGYNPTTDLHSLSESLGRELLLDGAMCLELVLDEQNLPLYPAPVAVSKLQFREDRQKGVYPVQVIGGEEYDLDSPTVFYVSVDQDLLTPFAVGFLAVSVRAVLNDERFSNFLQRQLARNLSPRTVATIIEEKIKKSVSVEVSSDPKKFAAHIENIIGQIESNLMDLQPEDALISTDGVTYDMKAPGGTGAGVGDLLKAVHDILQDRVTSSLKSLPAVLGRDSSSGSATTSTMLFLKSAEVIIAKLDVLYSRMFTLAVRILGHNCYVKFRYDDLDLRPKGEQEAYKSMKQSRILDLLSIGFYTDEQACVMLTGQLPPEGYQPKTGTMFRGGSSSQVQNTTSQTSLMNGQKDDLKSSTPEAPKGGQKK